ncbi:lipoprotein [Mycoplasma feriruminatoris]|uniref:Lipoprotein n=1 Tax=Mycoplasma feriruminatoris TaxID=1179777 RepID=A0AAQ3DMW4_9MOLU|nr:lipoprotein [Mycoplasma feriruminatoris]WFQ94865.1 lipoprotein [Mycoplasma feriruminatoris]
MKKLLSIITGFSFIVTPSLFAISCTPKVQVEKNFDDITSIKNVGVFKNNQAFISRTELKEILNSGLASGRVINNSTTATMGGSTTTNSEAATNSGASGNGTTTQNNTNGKYAIERLKALTVNNFTKNQQKAWTQLDFSSMIFYKKVEPSAVNVLGYEEINKDNVEKLDKGLKTVFLVFKYDTKESEKLEVELLPEIEQSNKVIDNQTLHLDLFEKPENLKLANQKSIVEVLRKPLSEISTLLNDRTNNRPNNNKENLKETEFFNNVIKELSLYLANAVKYFNSESGVVTTQPSFSYTARSKHIYDYITKNKKDDLYSRLEKVFKTEFTKINFLDVFNGFMFDVSDTKNNDEKIITKIIKTSTNNSSSSSTTPATPAPAMPSTPAAPAAPATPATR